MERVALHSRQAMRRIVQNNRKYEKEMIAIMDFDRSPRTDYWMEFYCTRDDSLWFLERLVLQSMVELAWMKRWCFAGAKAPLVIRPARVAQIIRRFFVRRLPMWSSRRWRSVT